MAAASADIRPSVATIEDASASMRREELLRQREQDFHVLAENSTDAIARYDRDGRRTYVNRAFAELAGRPVPALLGTRPTDAAAGPAAAEFEQRLRAVIASGLGDQLECVWPRPDGQIVTQHIRLTPEFDRHGKLVCVLGVGRDISALKQAERQLLRAEAMAQIGHWQWDCLLRQSLVSAEMCHIFGQPPDWRPDLHAIFSLIVDEDAPRIQGLVEAACARHDDEVAFGYRIVGGNGFAHLHTVMQIEYRDNGRPARLIGTTQNITELKNYEYHLHDLGFTDMLTGLPNRALFNDRFRQALAEAQRHGKLLGLMVLGLDRFKEVNDTFGHGSGDRLLYDTAERLKGLLRPYDTIARLGGDEFAILLTGMRDPTHIDGVACKVLEAFSRPFHSDGWEIFVSTSIGISVFPTDATDAGPLLQYADAALNHAKATGQGSCCFYSSELTVRSQKRMAMEAALRHALQRQELHLHYQPQVELATGRLVGVEALMRWQHPELGNVPPIEFIGLAEETGLIVELGEWALRTACQQARLWNASQDRHISVAVNLSTRQFRDEDFAARLMAIVAAADCRPEWIELEITESLLLDDRASIRDTLDTLANAGFTIAIDDFGTGYSALGYLSRFPIHTLKIDRSFISGVRENTANAELVKAILSMAQALRLSVVAEGIEEPAEEAFLKGNGCRLGQGYYYGKPMSSDSFEARFPSARQVATPGPVDGQTHE